MKVFFSPFLPGLLPLFTFLGEEPKSVTTFDFVTFFRTDLIQSEASWKLPSTSDWLMSAWKIVS